MMIQDGRAIAATSLTTPVDDLRAYLLTCYPKAEIPPMDHVVLTAAPLVARVNHGMWIASCSCGAKGLPTPGCVVFLDSPLGWCVRCGNRAWGGGWRWIVVPGEGERREIEAVLSCRGNPADRNWSPGETVEMLMAENWAHGDPVPDLDGVRLGPVHGPFLDEGVAPFPPSAVIHGRAAPRDTLNRFRRMLGV
jgi:hypothetical protein